MQVSAAARGAGLETAEHVWFYTLPPADLEGLPKTAATRLLFAQRVELPAAATGVLAPSTAHLEPFRGLSPSQRREEGHGGTEAERPLAL